MLKGYTGIIGAAALVALLSLGSTCKEGMSLDDADLIKQPTTISEKTQIIDKDEKSQMVSDTPAIGDQTPAPHPDKQKEKKADAIDYGQKQYDLPSSPLR